MSGYENISRNARKAAESCDRKLVLSAISQDLISKSLMHSTVCYNWKNRDEKFEKDGKI